MELEDFSGDFSVERNLGRENHTQESSEKKPPKIRESPKTSKNPPVPTTEMVCSWRFFRAWIRDASWLSSGHGPGPFAEIHL